MFGIGTPELLIIAAIFMLLFGATRLPSLMRNMGRSVGEFKQGLSDEPEKSDGPEKIEHKDTTDENDSADEKEEVHS